jgi:hypothetical protein
LGLKKDSELPTQDRNAQEAYEKLMQQSKVLLPCDMLVMKQLYRSSNDQSLHENSS